MKIGLLVFALCLELVNRLPAAEETASTPHPEERPGTATIVHRSDVVPPQPTNGLPRGGLWSLYSSPESRINYFEVTSRTGLHFHPDADHKLYVLEGKLVVTSGTNTTVATVGDFIIIPKGVRHSYDVPAKGDRALLLTFDAPPYDPRKTISLESVGRGK